MLSPVEVDRWTNYRYYDENSIVRLSEISYLKELGFSLKDIKNFSEETIKEKILQTKLNIKKLTLNINKLATIRKKENKFYMKNFVNDERVVGKWKKVAVVKYKEDFVLNKFDDNCFFDFEELYFLPNGENYWVFSWTKGYLFLKDRQFPYEIIDGKLFVGIVDSKTKQIENYAVYEKLDDKHYKTENISIKDNTNIPFISDKKVIGFWEAIDYVNNIAQFSPNKKFYENTLFLKKYTFEPDGSLIATNNKDNKVDKLLWSKNVIINKLMSTVSEYIIKTINNTEYMFVEWKSGDYIFGGKVNGYYCFKKYDINQNLI